MSRRRRRDEDEGGRVTLAPGMLAVPNVTLTRKIAEGGMGSVWAPRSQDHSGREVRPR
jgi:hypothetical protein